MFSISCVGSVSNSSTSSDEAFQKGLVDLWPLMADLPERRKRIHMTPPWLRSYYVLLFRAGSVPPDRKSTGDIAVFSMCAVKRESFSSVWLPGHDSTYDPLVHKMI